MFDPPSAAPTKKASYLALPIRPRGGGAADAVPSHFRNTLHGLTARDLHTKLINDYVSYHGKQGLDERIADAQRNAVAGARTEAQIVKDEWKFLHNPSTANTAASKTTTMQTMTWEQAVAKKYHDKLFKEYALANLQHYEVSKCGLRWRTESEVRLGKGQFQCGNLVCTHDTNLKSWEVNFAYIEDQVQKNALVKVRLCPMCSIKLNWRKLEKSEKREFRKGRLADLRETVAFASSATTSSKRKCKDSESLNDTGSTSGDEKYCKKEKKTRKVAKMKRKSKRDFEEGEGTGDVDDEINTLVQSLLQ